MGRSAVCCRRQRGISLLAAGGLAPDYRGTDMNTASVTSSAPLMLTGLTPQQQQMVQQIHERDQAIAAAVLKALEQPLAQAIYQRDAIRDAKVAAATVKQLADAGLLVPGALARIKV